MNENKNNKNKIDDNIIKLSKDLEKYKTEASENWELFVRAKAEMDNIKKRTEKEINKINKYSQKKIFTDLLPILDSFDSCLNNKKNKNQNDYLGIALIYKMLISVLQKNNVNKIIVNKFDQFDPTKHEAISIIKNKTHDNKILSIFQSGYILHDQIIRYAKVSIFKKESK